MNKSIATIEISDEPFDPQAVHATFCAAHKDAGAIASFLGQVRNEKNSVKKLVLEHYPGFTEKEIQKIAADACRRWPLDGLCIVHRVGDLNPGEPIVFVATASAHRRAAFEAVDFLMDYLKSDAPFWKKEAGESSERWIEPREQDLCDKMRWRTKTAV